MLLARGPRACVQMLSFSANDVVIEYRSVRITKLVFIVLQQAQAVQTQVPPMTQQAQHTFWNGPAANWAVAIGTLILAFVAVFQEWIKSWFFKPVLDLDVGIPLTRSDVAVH